MTQLSPAAQAVLDAYFTHADLLNREVSHEEMLAAALRAAVKQTRKRKVLKTLWITTAQTPIYCLESDLLAIATELEGQ